MEAVEDIKVSGNVRNTKEIATNGDFSGKNVVSKGKIISKNFESHDLENDGKILADGKVKARKVKNTGEISATGDVSTDDLKTSGKISAKNLESEDLDNDGKISSNENVKARNIKNTGEIQAVGSISGNDLKTSGKVRANRKTTVSGELENGGDLESGKSLTVSKNIRNTGKIAVNEDISGKDTQNSGSLYSKNLKTDNLKNDGKVEVGNDLKTADIENTKDITAVGKISGGNVNNSGKILTNGTLDVKNVKNIGKIAAGSDVTSQRLENSGILATNGNITTSDSMINSGNIEGKNLDITGLEFTNSGKISAGNIRARVNDTKNDGSISSANDIDLTTNTLTNIKEMLAVNSINSNNATVLNSGKMASNGKILLNNSSITNIGEILSGEISMQNAKKFDNTGTVKGNKTVLTTNQDLNLVGNLHGESLLEISGNNITNNGNTTGAGLIKISSNDFTNNKELASSAVIIDGRGNVVNNNMITGNDGKINGNSITNNDLIAFDNYLEMNAKSKVLNNKDKSIYGGNALIIKGSEILNDEGEILGGNMDLNASKITNNVGTVQSTGDIFVTSNDFQNIGRVSNLGSYEKYYETWDRIKLSESEVASKWLLNDNGGWKKKTSGHTRKKARKEQKEWFEKQIQNSNRSESKSYLLTKYEQFFRSILGHTNVDDSKKVAGSAKDPTIPLVGKLKSKASTEYGKVLANGNITINSGNFKNKDSLISGGGLVNITATNFENSVSIDDKNPIKLKNGREVLDLNIKEGTHHHILRTTLVAVHTRDMVDGDIGYATGQPSIIEGSLVNVNAPNIIKNSIEAGNGKVLNNGGATGRALISSNSIGINKGTGSANGAVQVAGNTLLSKVNSGFNGNLQVNGSGNNSFDRAIQISGNNSVIQNIKKTGTIDVNPLLSSAMFTMNMGPSSKYLLETRSKYISLGQYYGSDYFTSRVGYSEIWDRSKRLGDAFYENQLLTRALNEKLGTSFLNGKSNQELIQSMIDNAADEKARLGLVVGQALTQDQINALNEDIIWYVSKEVNGVSVLTPQIYLSSRTRESISDDTRNRVGGINGTYVKTKDFVNDGTKWGNGGVTYVEANTVRNETATNLLSEISGDRTYINAAGNIENIGGRINGEEAVALISEKGNVINDTTKRNVGYNNGEYDRTHHEEVASIGGITSKGTTFIKADKYISTGGILKTDHIALDVNKIDERALTLSGEDKFGSGESNYSRYSETTNLGAGIMANSAEGRVGDINLKGSSFIAEDTTGLTVTGNVRAESAVNSYDTESRQSSKGFMSSKSSYKNSRAEENSASNLMLGKNAVITGNVEGIGSNIVLGENTFVGGKVTTDSRELHNSYYEKNRSKGFTGGVSHGTISAGYGKSQSTYDEKSTINAKSNLQVGDGSVLNRGAEITATNFEYGNIQINNGDVKYGARIDTRDVHTSSKSSGFTISAGINSPALDRAKQVGQAVSQIKNGDTAGGAMEAVNAATGTIKGLSENITKRDGTRATMNDIRNNDFKVNNDFYVSGNIRAGFNKSKSSTASHTESAAVTTMKPLNENSSITYNNVNNITYQGTQAQGGTFIYNNVANIQKEAVELRNSYSSESSGFGVGVSAGIGSNGQIKPNGISGNVSTNRSNQNTVETVYANGNFKNVNEVHNNTGSMTLSGFNQEGGKVTGNIGKLVVESRQNTSTTTGSSRGASIGISSSGVPNSVNVNASRTNGNRSFVDNQSTFIVGEGSNLHIGTLDNTAGIIGKEGNSKLTVDKYTGHDLQNKDEMTINGASIGVSIGNNSSRLSNIGISSENRDKQGITRNTVIGDVEIGQASGDPINRDRAKANEITKDTHSKTNVNVESQTLDYLANPEKFKQDLDIAILEGQITADGAIKKIENIVNGRKNSDIGDPEIRKFEDMKDYYLRAKTAPDIDLLVKADLSDKEVQEQLGIGGKFNPDDPNLPQKVKDRIADARKNQGKEIPYFYDKVTGKIYINENADVNTVKAGIAREWAIREQLEAGNGKENNEGKPKATVAGEIAYNEVMKRTKGQDNNDVFSGLDYGQLDENSEITADFTWKHLEKGGKALIRIGTKYFSGDKKGAEAEFNQLKKDTIRVLKRDYDDYKAGGDRRKKVVAESTQAIVTGVKHFLPKPTKSNKSSGSGKGKGNGKTSTPAKPKKISPPKKKTDGPTLGDRLRKAGEGGLDIVTGGLTSAGGVALIGASEGVDYVTIGGSVVPSLPVKIAGGTAVVVGGNKAFHGLMKIGDAIFGNKEQVNGPSLNPLRDTVGALTKRPELYDTFEFLTEIGVASIAPITVGGVPKTFTKNSNSNSTISGKSNSQNHNWNLNGKSGDYLDKTTRKVKVTPNITETIKNSNINASKSTNWGLGNLNSKNIMDTTVGSYLNNLNSKVNNNKSYDPTPKLDYNKPLDNSLYKGVKNTEGNYTLGRNNEWSVNNTVTSVKRISENQNNIYDVELNNGMTPGYTLIRKSDIKVTADENKINNHNETWELRMESKYKNSPIFGCHTIECMKNILKEHPEIQFDVKEVSNGVKSVKYRVPKRNSAQAIEQNNGGVEYRKFVRNPKTVYDTRVYKTEDLTKQVINEVKNVITPNDVQRAYSNPNSNVPLDIKINNQKIRVNIKPDASTGGIEIDGYYFHGN